LIFLRKYDIIIGINISYVLRCFVQRMRWALGWKMKQSKLKKSAKTTPLVSIVMPAFNSEEFICNAVDSVLAQTYENWELIIVDDHSTDNTRKVLKKFESFNKIRVITCKKNGGAAKARNRGIAEARGSFLCFIDADDLWEPDKLSRQLAFMSKKGAAFTFTSYTFAGANGVPNGKIVHVPSTITYKQALRNTTIWTSTVMLDMTKLSKKDVEMPDVRRGQDTATWWKILKKVEKAYGLNEVMAIYRRSDRTLSSNKITALKRTWNLYRNVEHLNVFKSSFCFVFYCLNAVRRRV